MGFVPVERIDTSDVPAALRTERWRDFTSRTMVRLTCSTLDSTGIVGLQVNIRRPDHVSVLIQGQPHFVQRSVLDIEAMPSGMAQVSFVDRGQVYFQDGTGMHVAHGGDVLVFDTDQPYAMSIPHDVVMRSVHVPRSLVDGNPTWEPSAGVLSAAAVHTATTELQQARHLLNDFLDEEFTATPHDRVDVTPWVKALFDGTAHRGSSSPWWDMVLTATRARLRDPDLRARHVADAIPLSERQLSRVLAEQQTTWHELVLRERLHLLRSDLVSPANRRRPVGDIIADCGFSSAAHAHRRFRGLTGSTPGAYRAEHATGPGGRPS